MRYRHVKKLIDTRARRSSAARLAILTIPFAVFFAVVLAKAFYIQIGGVGRYRKEAHDNMYCRVPQPPVRGDITDRNGAVLAVDHSKFRIVTIGRNCSWKEVDENIPPAIADALERATGEKRIEAVEALRAKRFREISRLVEQPEAHPGVFVDIVPSRVYPQGTYASQVIGYLGEINQDERKRLRHKGYIPGDRVGKAGVERYYEMQLSGKRGNRLIMTDAPGKLLSEQKTIAAKKGRPLKLTLDLRLQKAAVEAFRSRKVRGAAIFMTTSGEILAITGSPTFSPAPGPDGMTPANWAAMSADPAHPLLNRAVSSNLPLGSVFKLVVATAAIEEKAASFNSSFFCPGYYSLPGRRSYPPKCYTSHGRILFNDGIAQSCDVVFYILGQKLGVTKIKKYAKMMGLGSKTGIDLPGESVGLVPDEYWKKHFGGGAKWNAGDTINLSIGQGNMQVTPVQVARMVNVFASGGRLVTPHLSYIGDTSIAGLPLRSETLAFVRRGMRGAVTSGTCRGIADFPVPVAAKTGTAQTGTRRNPKPPHSWFAGFAPYDEPRITFAVYVEHGGYGAEAALPIAKDILKRAYETGYFDEYLRKRNKSPAHTGH